MHALTGGGRCAASSPPAASSTRTTPCNQLHGRADPGIGSALREAMESDRKRARYVHGKIYVHGNIAEYPIPVLADAPRIEVTLLEEDRRGEPARYPGARGAGDVGTNAAIAAAS
ncbi:hypothetical protein JYK14_18270 [Siccirubricoccus sp. KC 17139]|uniref:Aldehyde oxidase/xanthine dehydrogenase a/b hammerhead domain-containing protein n=1 Tax=Siccirubricoccus soli TaxID=2899147 RepID=A0ABT1D820_9PROT|nr:hypothetical protein [Siccirubricoccus soli]MCO6418093.1 hypothetical protein [Siccirubricoccus soli]MCP2684228.1 hypothetical protein [Siccirubricoccus soli]